MPKKLLKVNSSLVLFVKSENLSELEDSNVKDITCMGIDGNVAYMLNKKKHKAKNPKEKNCSETKIQKPGMNRADRLIREQHPTDCPVCTSINNTSKINRK